MKGAMYTNESTGGTFTVETDWHRLGYSESWINNRVKNIEVRKGLTDEWDRAGVKQGQQYASLTDIITQEWSGKTTRQYKQLTAFSSFAPRSFKLDDTRFGVGSLKREGTLNIMLTALTFVARNSQSKLCLSSRCSLGSKSCTLPRRTSC